MGVSSRSRGSCAEHRVSRDQGRCYSAAPHSDWNDGDAQSGYGDHRDHSALLCRVELGRRHPDGGEKNGKLKWDWDTHHSAGPASSAVSVASSFPSAGVALAEHCWGYSSLSASEPFVQA